MSFNAVGDQLLFSIFIPDEVPFINEAKFSMLDVVRIAQPYDKRDIFIYWLKKFQSNSLFGNSSKKLLIISHSNGFIPDVEFFLACKRFFLYPIFLPSHLVTTMDPLSHIFSKNIKFNFLKLYDNWLLENLLENFDVDILLEIYEKAFIQTEKLQTVVNGFHLSKIINN